MEPRKLSIMIATFPYSGNGGISSQADEVSDWVIETMLKGERDPRIEWIKKAKFSDTPITLTRNRSVMAARECGADILLMVDSDMFPDKRFKEGDPFAKPFFDSSFDFLYEHYDRGPVVIGAPYCGPPPNEVVYVFHWKNEQSDNPNLNTQLAKYPREHAATMSGIQHCAALPTGLIMFDMRIFELTEPKRKREALMKQLMGPIKQQFADGLPLTLDGTREIVQRCLDSKERAEQSWFYYEWTDQYQQDKGSTEDVTATRDIAMHGRMELGYNPLRVNWDAWAGHFKVKCVDKPVSIFAEEVGDKFIRAAKENRSRSLRRVELYVDHGGNGKGDVCDKELVPQL